MRFLSVGIDNLLDLNLFKKSFLVLAAFMLPIGLADGIWLHWVQALNTGVQTASVSETIRRKDLMPLSFYTEVFDRDTLFGKVSSPVNVSLVKTPIAEIVKDFRLKGVIFAGEPEAILQDARSQKTNFVKVGTQMGDLTVREIKEGQIEVSSGDEVATLQIQ